MITIQDVLKIDEKVKEKWGKQFYKYIDPCGLEPSGQYSYESTPRNSITFASTGGNGVHFGLLTDHNNLKGPLPVIMTVPMVSKNVVLAETLDEFFGLGYYNGWFALEQLVYDFDETIKFYSTPNPNPSVGEKNFLELVNKELGSKYAPLTKERLELLERKYHGKLVV